MFSNSSGACSPKQVFETIKCIVHVTQNIVATCVMMKPHDLGSWYRKCKQSKGMRYVHTQNPTENINKGYSSVIFTLPRLGLLRHECDVVHAVYAERRQSYSYINLRLIVASKGEDFFCIQHHPSWSFNVHHILHVSEQCLKQRKNKSRNIPDVRLLLW